MNNETSSGKSHNASTDSAAEVLLEQNDFQRDPETDLLLPDFEGRFHTKAIPPNVIVRITAEPRLAPFSVKWDWNEAGLQLVSADHKGWIDYDEHGRADRSKTISFSSRSLLATFDFGGVIEGGRFTAECVVHWKDPRTSQTGDTSLGNKTFSIRGDNPGKADIKALLSSIRTQVLAYMESRFRQFDQVGLPLFGPPHGFGVMQLDTPRPNATQLWDWKENINGGLALFQIKIKEVNNHFANIYRQHPEAPHLTDEQMSKAIYQYYNGGFYWDWDAANHAWTKKGTTSYGDAALKVERLVAAGTPPGDWS